MKYLIIFFTVIGSVCSAQESADSLSKVQEKSPGVFSVLFKGKPGKALAYSLMLPGAGQVYNKRIWKVPIIYAGFGALAYAVSFNTKQYRRFNDAYIMRVDSMEASLDEFQGILSLSGINSYRQFYDKNLQLSYIGIGILYLLTGIEAFVDRHLQEFDISKDLSFKYQLDPFKGQGQVSIIWALK
ncbi:MAG: hypothetical protein IPI45_04155 [Saprospiraceae bacterium]|nr:hypothetical protein [Saprospiraceae bacterium]MBK7736954.1 hypothetical protein [Saprospiraceae bacterium]MBK7914452.1 hypothetical protein [Saprospiraceae bacterium]